MRPALSCLTICLLTFFAPALLGQTPDGRTPADEDPCGLESGAAFGLCISYCEAMDCDGPDPAASEDACLTVKDQYVQITGNPRLPCEAVCDNDGVCEMGEDCTSCANDCPSLPPGGAVCGNSVCEAGDGENCYTCPEDCNGQTGGKPANRFCCGNNAGESTPYNPDGCGDPRCTSDPFLCTEIPVGGGGGACCGDLVCEAPEDSFTCDIDCS